MATKFVPGVTAEAALRKFIAEKFLFSDVDSLTIGDDDSFIENGIVDSTGILELQMFVEEEFGIEVRDEEVVPENFDSVEALARYVRAKQYGMLPKAANG